MRADMALRSTIRVWIFRDRPNARAFMKVAVPAMAPPTVLYYTLVIKPCAGVVATARDGLHSRCA
jgi:hypothetical protein